MYMLSASRTPAASPAIRTASSVACGSLHYVPTPSSPLSRTHQSPRIRLSSSLCAPGDVSHSPRGSPTLGGYFNLPATSTPRRLGYPHSPGLPLPSPIGETTPLAQSPAEPADGRLCMNGSPAIQVESTTPVRRKPVFHLAFRRPEERWESSSDVAAFARHVMFSAGNPREWIRSESTESVMTLKPIRGRVPTPYPKNEWIEDVDEAIGSM